MRLLTSGHVSRCFAIALSFTSLAIILLMVIYAEENRHYLKVKDAGAKLTSQNKSKTPSSVVVISKIVDPPKYKAKFAPASPLEKPSASGEVQKSQVLKAGKERFCSKPDVRLWTKKPELLEDESSLPACSKIFRAIENGTKKERRRLFDAAINWTIPEPHNDSSVLELTSNCTKLLETVKFPTEPSTTEEAEYPLAYVFVFNQNAAQAIRAFRMLYQPQNAFCFTYDTKSKEEHKKFIHSLASCFPNNVYINPKPEPIYYMTFTLLHSVMECLKVLRNSPIPWRYVQIVSWNDFPIKSNWEMVKIFKILNGSQDCELVPNNTPEHVAFINGQHPNGVRRPIPPAGLTFYKGSFSTSMTKEFIEWMFDNPISVKFYNYLNGSKFPDEQYWTTLIHNVHLNSPGAFPGECLVWYGYQGEKKPYMSRFQIWDYEISHDRDMVCRGKSIRFSCVFGVKDLPAIIKAKEIVAHKMWEEYQPALHYCLEEWYWQRVCMGDTRMNETYYANLPTVRYHNLPEDQKETFICTV